MNTTLDQFICSFCKSIRKSKKSLIAHEATCPTNPKGYRNIPWNKSKTKDNDSRLKSLSEKMTGRERPDLVANHPLKGKRWGAGITGHTNETKSKLSSIAKNRGLGGYNKRSGRGKKGRYKGYWCDSSYELAWVIFNIDHNIPFTRNNEKFDYYYQDKLLRWIPDFKLNDGSFVEIKGYETEQSKAKLENFPHRITLLKEKDLQDVFKYVKETYGADFINLYE